MNQGVAFWIDQTDRLNISFAGTRFHTYPGWGHTLCYGVLFGLACLSAAGFYAGVRHVGGLRSS